ncbi:MAG: hypothetical protein U9M95_00135 [Candidatus Altiarchaeota archaeon]|nr:hypothetical protein [Candidatus Altiarchaeota archaeon]
MDEINLIEKCVRVGEDNPLSKAMDFYWPVEKKDNDMSERNISMLVIRSFIANGFHVYAEVLYNHKPPKYVDFIAIKPDGNVADILVVGEAKNLYGTGQAEAMCGDIEKIHEFKLPRGPRWDRPKPRLKIGLLIVFTWDRKIVEWWENWDSDSPLGGGGAGWRLLMEELNRYNAKRGTYLLHDDGEEAENERERECNALYAIFQVD